MNRSLSLIISCLILVLASVGCNSQTDNAQGPDGVLKISVAAQNNSGQVFQYIAKKHNYLAEEGVDVELIYINNGTDAFSALSSGQVNVISTYGTGGPLIQIANNRDFTVFGGYMIIGETPCYGKPGTPWTGVESFRDKTIGITRGGTPDIVLKGILFDAGRILAQSLLLSHAGYRTMDAGYCQSGSALSFTPRLSEG